MREDGGGDHVSVGMRKPNGEYERPIPGTKLFWTKPGNFAGLRGTKNLGCNEFKCIIFFKKLICTKEMIEEAIGFLLKKYTP